ncbi:MAG: YifB family Mg chelatase-like AAA ATPase, partial [Actinomycetota bacterium]|nr:YifB family Mg chelatase-like AAA ATPase [Actinomycetota bacterium]
GLPSFAIVGLPDTAVRESRERVRAALINSGFEFPLQRIITNLAPADVPKVGPGFDLAIAAAVLAASNQVPKAFLDQYAFAGELALDGSIRPVPGALAMAEAARGQGLRGVAVAPADGALAALVEGIEVVGLEHVARLPVLSEGEIEPLAPRVPEAVGGVSRPDLRDLKGQPAVRNALEIVAAGGHSLLLVGPPGAGKTLAAQRLPSLLPPLAPAEALDVIRIAGACGNGIATAVPERPFRSPHHTVSARALIGGGSPPRPGEVTRAHRGVLFLDELGEFRRDALEALRQPLEEGTVTLARARRTISLPCRFSLVAASNPCPCGQGGDSGACECHPSALARYEAKLSGALADRIDVFVGVGRPGADELAGAAGEPSSEVRARVSAARQRQRERLGDGRCNAEMTPEETRRHCALDAGAERTLRDGHDRFGLSGRGWDRVLRVARTIADLESEDSIRDADVIRALGMRRRKAA